MNILALESSTELCSAALWRDGRIDAREAGAGQRNSEVLLPMVEALLAAQAVQRCDLDGIAFGSGPGSFTGLRIACGVAQGIAFGVSLPVAGVVTLRALAEAAQAPRVDLLPRCAHGRDLPRRLREGRRRLARGLRAESVQTRGRAGSAGRRLARLRQRLCGVRRSARTALRRAAGGVLDGVAPHAREVAALAARMFARGETVAAELAAPLYVRNKVALRVDER